MALRPVHVLLALVPLLAYLFYRTATLEADVHALERRLASFERGASAAAVAVTAGPAGSGGGGGVAAAPGAPGAPGDLRAEVAALRQKQGKLEARLDALGSTDQILGVVEEEQHRKQQLLVDFHSERWHERAEEVLGFLAQTAGFTEFQRTRVGSAMSDEVDKIAEIARRPDLFDDPDQLANDVIQLLDETDTRVLSILNPQQKAAWERHRAHERTTMYSWLPR